MRLWLGRKAVEAAAVAFINLENALHVVETAGTVWNPIQQSSMMANVQVLTH